MRQDVLRYLAAVLCVAVIPFALAYGAFGMLRAAGFDLTGAALVAAAVGFLALSAGGVVSAKRGGGDGGGESGS